MATYEESEIETRALIPAIAQIVSREEISRGLKEKPGEDLLAIRQELAEQAARNARLELDHLKKLLSSQDEGRRQAQRTAAFAHRQLKILETDNGRIRIELQHVRQQLAVTRQEHIVEMCQAADRESQLKDALLAARGEASTALDSKTGRRRKWIAITAIVALPVAMWAATSLRRYGTATAPRSQPSETPAFVTSAAEETRDFTGALGRLDDALGNFKGVSPETVLRRVHNEGAAHGVNVCSFEWNGGNISLLFGGGEGGDPPAAVTRCAEAVAKAAK